MIEGLDQAVTAIGEIVRLIGRGWRALRRRAGIDAPEPPVVRLGPGPAKQEQGHVTAAAPALRAWPARGE